MGKAKSRSKKNVDKKRLTRAEKKLKKTYSDRAYLGWETRRRNLKLGITTKQRRAKKTSGTVRVLSRSGVREQQVEIHKRTIKLTRAIKVNEFNAVPEIEFALFEHVMDAYDSLKRSKKKLNLFNFSILWRARSGSNSVIPNEIFSIGNAEIKNKSQFKLYFRRVISAFAASLTDYVGRGLSLYVSGAVLDAISKTKSNKKPKKAKTVRGRRS